MLSDFDLNQIASKTTSQEVSLLVDEVKRLQKYLLDYNISMSQKIDIIEENMLLLEAENQRLLEAKSIVYVERDSCISLLAKLAVAHGHVAGTAPGNTVAVNLPSGQVNWEFGQTEAHLFAHLPAFPESIEPLEMGENYHRVMNPGL